MKYIGAAYILWFAIHIAISKPSSESTEQSASFLKGFMLQFVNVKIYMFGVIALTGYVVNYMTSFPPLLFFELVIATIATCTWIGCIDSEISRQKWKLKNTQLNFSQPCIFLPIDL